MKYVLPLFFFSFHALSLFAQAPQTEQWKKVVDSKAPDTARFNACIDLHNFYFKTTPEESLLYSKKALEIAEASGKEILHTKAYMMLARCARKKRSYGEVIPYDFKAYEHAGKTGNADLVFQTTMQLATDHLDAEKKKEGYQWLKKCEALAARSQKKDPLAAIYQKLAYYYHISDKHRAAIQYFDKAIAVYREMGNGYKVAESALFKVESMIKIGRTKGASDELFEAIEIFRKAEAISRLGAAYRLLGVVFMMNGDTDKGIGYLQEAKKLYRSSNNFTEEGLVIPEIVRAYLYRKDFDKALQYLQEASSIFDTQQYDIGKATIKTLWGQYYSEKGEWTKADQQFADAAVLINTVDMPDLKLENDKQQAVHKYRQNKVKEADSLTYQYAAYMTANKDPETISLELEMIRNRNRGLDSNMLKLLKVLYAPGGAERLKQTLQDKKLSSIVAIDSLFRLNPYSKASPEFDSSMTAAYNKQFLELETRYRTRQIADSLANQQQANIIARQRLMQRNYLSMGAFAFALLLAIFGVVQFNNRRKAERAEEHIRTLKNEVHHRVKNNLAVINRLVDVAGKHTEDQVPLSALKSRIKSIELLHHHLHGEDAKPGFISLQPYFENLASYISSTFVTAANIRTSIRAAEEVDMVVAEKLGLIVNELMTNSYKYAFAGREEGTFSIRVEKKAHSLELLVQDDGPGFDANLQQKSYGMKLIRGLSHQLDGKFEFGNAGGAVFRLVVPV